MIDPGRLQKILAILRYEAQKKGVARSDATPEQRRAYFDNLLSVGGNQTNRRLWTSKAPQHGFRGPSEDREQAPQPKPYLNPLEKAKDTYAQIQSGLGSTSMKMGEGVLRLAGNEEGADKIRTEYEKQVAKIGPAKSGWGVAGGMVGTVGAFAPAMLVGGGALVPSLVAGAAMDLPAAASGRDFSVLGMVADWRKRKAEKEGRPLSSTEAGLERGAESPWARGAVDAGLGLGAGLLGELLPGARAARRAEDARIAERSKPPLPPILKDADQGAIDKILEAQRVAERAPKYGPERRAVTRPESPKPQRAKGEKAVLGVSAPPGVVQTYEDLLQMHPDEVKKAAKALKDYEEGSATEIFGKERAVQYERAQRIVNSSMADPHSEKYKQAGELIDQMEGGLTPVQEARLFGIGQTGPNYEEVKELARHAHSYSPEILVDEPTEVLVRSFVGLAGGDRPPADLLTRYALPRVFGELSSRGIPDKQLLDATIRRIVARTGIDPTTAAEALSGRMQQWRAMPTAPTGTRVPNRPLLQSGRGERGAVHLAAVKALVRTGIGAAGGAAATSGEGGLTPLEGAGLGALALNAPSMIRGGKRLLGGAEKVKGAKVPQHPVLISELTPQLKNDYDVTISSLADSAEGIPEVVARAGRLKPGFPEKITRGKAERVAMAEATPIEEVLSKPAGPLDDVEVEVLKLNYNKNREELRNLYARQATEIDAVEASKIDARIGELEGVNDQIINRRVPSASDMGRAFAALRGDFDASSPLAWIQRSKKIIGRDLTEAEREEVQRLIKAGDHEEAAGYIRSLSEPLTMKDLGFWTLARKGGSLLAAPVSVLRPLVGNPTNAAFNAVSRPATVLIDVMASILRSGSPTAARSTSTRGTGRQLWEGLKGAAQGVPEGGRILLSGLDPAAAEKLEIQRGQRLKSPLGFDVPESIRQKLPKGFRPRRIDAVDAWTQFWLRIQGAVDRPFRTATVRASNVEQASLIARREKLKGVDYKKRVEFLIANPTPEMSILSNLRADHISFQNDTWLSSAVSAGKRVLGGSEKVGTRSTGLSPTILAGAELIQPFSRTPSSIIVQGMEATPFGLTGVASDAVRVAKAVSKGDEKLANELQRRLASRGGRVITGLIPIWLGAKWHREGKMIATQPEAGSERTQFYAEGKAPFTIHMGDRWVSVAQLGPVGAGFSFGAMLDRLAQSEEKTVRELLGSATESPSQFLNTAANVGAATVESTARLALETPFMKGTKDVVEALGDVQAKAGEKVAQVGASFIPNILAIEARDQDPVIRRPEGILETMKTRIPGQSQEVAPSLMAATGESTLREAPGHEQKWWHKVLGSSPDRTKFDATIAEMESVGAAVGKINKFKDETDDAYFRRQQVTGDMVQATVAAFANPQAPESASLFQALKIDPGLAVIYQAVKGKDRNDPQLKQALAMLGEMPGFPADVESAGGILEYAIGRARSFTTSTIRKARQP